MPGGVPGSKWLPVHVGVTASLLAHTILWHASGMACWGGYRPPLRRQGTELMG